MSNEEVITLLEGIYKEIDSLYDDFTNSWTEYENGKNEGISMAADIVQDEIYKLKRGHEDGKA